MNIAEKLGINTKQVQFTIKNSDTPSDVAIEIGLCGKKEAFLPLIKILFKDSLKTCSDTEIAAGLLHEYGHLLDGIILSNSLENTKNPFNIMLSHIQETSADMNVIKNPNIPIKEKLEIAQVAYMHYFENHDKQGIHMLKRNSIYPSKFKRARNFKHGVHVLLNEPGAFAAAPKTWLSMKLFGLLPSEKHFAYLAAKTPVGDSLITATVLTAGYCVVTTCKKWYQAYKEKRKKQTAKIDAASNHQTPTAQNSNLVLNP
ncbi:hypothetical protein IPH25_02385 [bacterium]|nr:MAG: hypothetical protein IPG37_04525 [bacterium]QQR62270.1 MAG: hypothetical protein IPH25_02385 [bacterium]QQR63165.1 MAG: hypothetical protein IPH67_01680 [bacterium]